MTVGGREFHRIGVELGPRSYDVIVGSGALEQLAELRRLPGSRPGSALLVADRGVPTSHRARAAAVLTGAGLRLHTLSITPSEEHKSLAGAEDILIAMSDHQLERGDLLVALGGGIVGDIAGFAAASYRRGISWVQCPTTLLSMVDASVGGKTGVNLFAGPKRELRKNMIGAFHQPRLVLADLDVLGSLPDRHFRAALSECLKHGLIGAEWGDPDLFGWTQHQGQAIIDRDPAVLAALIARNVALKARIVAADEREEAEQSGRALLNLGHTFAHALESIPGLAPPDSPAPLQHGEAVALGLVAAVGTAAAAGYCPAELAELVRTPLEQFGLPTRISGLPTARALIARMMHDKKVAGGRVRLILPTELGHARIFCDVPSEAIEAGIDAIRAGV
jgi:3-dehydroquinate synthase